MTIGSGAMIEGAVLLPGAQIGERSVVRASVVGAGAIIGADVVLEQVVIGDGARVGDGNELLAGVRVFPGHVIAAGAVRFSSDQS